MIRVCFDRNLSDWPNTLCIRNNLCQLIGQNRRCTAADVKRVEAITKVMIDFYFLLQGIEIGRGKGRLHFNPEKAAVWAKLLAKRDVNVKKVSAVFRGARRPGA